MTPAGADSDSAPYFPVVIRALLLWMLAWPLCMGAQVHTSYLWHMQQPIYWPEVSQANPHRYQSVQESEFLKWSGGNTYSDGLAHPLNDLGSIFGNDDRKAAYQWRPKDAVQSLMGHPEGGAQVNYSGCLIENVNSLAAANQWGYYPGWQQDFTTARNWTTSGGQRRMDLTAFSFHHVLSPLVSKAVLRKEIQMHEHLYTATFGPGYSKGYWPAECSFSERIIPVLVEEGLEWSIIANSHLARTLSDYPLVFGTNGCNIDPPNAADQVSTTGDHWWSGQIDGRGGQFAAPYCYQAHRAQHVDPATGEVFQMTVVPMGDLLSYQNGYATMGTGQIDAHIAPHDDPSHPSLVLMAHDGDNAWGGGYDYYANSVPNLANAAAAQGYVPSTIQQFLDDHPVPANDLVHVEDGSWFNAANDWGHPQFINWLWPLYDPTTHTFNPQGWTEDARNWAVLTAAENHVQMVEDIEGGADIPDIVSPSFSSSVAEKAWHFLLPGFTSGYMYYGTAIDMEVKPSLAANNAVAEAATVLDAWFGADPTPPSVFIPQRWPWNPGGLGFGPTSGYQQVEHSSDFAVWTYAYDQGGVASATLKYRIDDDGENPLTDHANDTYAGGPGVGDWVEVAMSMEPVPTGNVTGNGDIDFFIEPEVIADLYWAEVTGLENVLVDYHVEVVDLQGNVTRTDIQHVFVGSCNGCTVEGAGCDDPAAENYDPEALANDGSCLYPATLAVDMTGVAVSPLGVHVAGDFQGWDPAGTPLADQGDGLWSVDVLLPSGPILFKFINGNAWGAEETVGSECGAQNQFGGYDRLEYHVPGEPLPSYCWSSCTPCDGGGTDGGGGGSDPVEVQVTLQVNLDGATADPAGVHVAGTWQAWDPAGTAMTEIEDSGVWHWTGTFAPGTFIRYKFINGNAWGLDESVPGECADGIDRFLTVGGEDVVLEAVCFGTCTTCPGPPLPDGEPEDVSDCAADVDGDGIVAVADVLLVLGEYGCLSGCAFDVDGTPGLGVPDMLVILAAFGLVCP